MGIQNVEGKFPPRIFRMTPSVCASSSSAFTAPPSGGGP
jgi:hypothetical protein